MRQRKHMWINGTKGAISLLLAMLLLPFYSLAAVMVENMRYQSAVRTLDELLGTISVSNLSRYDEYLKDRFGLLAVEQSDSEDALTDFTLDYLEKNQLIDTAGIDMGTVSATGMYPLADTRVLRHQVEEYSKLLVPNRLVTDGLHMETIVSDLEEKLEGAFAWDLLFKGSDAVGAWADSIKAVNEAKTTAEAAEKTAEKYDTAYTDWKNAVADLSEHLDTPCPDRETDSEGYENWAETRRQLENAAEQAKNDYLTAISSMKDAVKELQEAADEVIEKREAAGSKTISVAAEAVTAGLEKRYAQKEAPEGTIESAADREARERQNAANKIITDQVGAINDGVDTACSSLDVRTEKLKQAMASDKMRTAYDALKTEEEKLRTFDPAVPREDPDTQLDREYHLAQVKELADPAALDRIMQDSLDEVATEGLLEVLNSIIDGFKSVFSATTFFDPAINCQLDPAFYIGELKLPSQKDRSGAFALAEGDPADEARAIRYLQEIDPDFIADDPFGLSNGISPDLMARIFENLAALLEDISSIISNFGTMEMVDSIVKACGHGAQLSEDIVTMGKQMEKQMEGLAASLGNRVLLNGYLVYDLPNRTTYCTSAETLTGYSFSEIAFGKSGGAVGRQMPIGLNDLLSVIEAIQTGGGVPSRAFGGAELEYVIWGANSEMLNQFYQFAALFVFRALISLQILGNAEVQAMAAASTVAYPVVAVGLVLLEALMDTVLLVNGHSVSLVNVFSPYVTPDGILRWIKEASNSFIQAGSDSGSGSGSGGTGQGGSTAPKKPGLSDGAKGIIETATSFDYQQHSLFLMMIFGNEEAYLQRLADLIQSESVAYQELHVSAFDRMDALVPFQIDESYTVIRTEASGTLIPLLPVPVLSGKGPLTMDRLVYRGY